MHIERLIKRYPELLQQKEAIAEASKLLVSVFRSGNKLLVCGNGGSAADAGHIAAELMKGFEKKRPLKSGFRSELSRTGGERGSYLAESLNSGLPVISLASHGELMTAVANDIDPALIFAQQVISFGRDGDALLAISTSGNSANVTDAAIAAKACGMKVIGLTGASGGRLGPLCDILINVSADRTADIQELHSPVYHTLCRIVEDELFG